MLTISVRRRTRSGYEKLLGSSWPTGGDRAEWTATLKILYLAHDLSDAAVRKRVDMLRSGGASIEVAGFRRASPAGMSSPGVPGLDLGVTYDGDLRQRALRVTEWVLNPRPLATLAVGVDVILARNLEMLAIASRLRDRYAPQARLVYECLDIHWSLSGSGLVSRILRSLERSLMRRCSLLIVSSPAFLENYFRRIQRLDPPTLLLENKVFCLERQELGKGPSRLGPPAGPPWRIGWFGVLRSQTALDALCSIATALPGQVEIIIRGKYSTVDFANFEGQIARTPGVTFGGAYTVDDLPQLYADIHICWAMDLSSDGPNAVWLLPNRIYEGGLHAVVPIARAGTETGRWLAARELGLLVDDPVTDTVAALSALTAAAYQRLKARTLALDISDVVADLSDCRALVAALGEAAP